jgi:phage tail-like protein
MKKNPQMNAQNWTGTDQPSRIEERSTPIRLSPGFLEDPLVGFHFCFEAGLFTAFFSELEDLGTQNEIIEHKIIVGDQEVIQKLPGSLEYYNLILRRGLTSNMDVYDWRKLVEDGDINSARLDAVLTMLDQESSPVASWDLVDCWPSALELVTSGDGIILEQVTVVMDGLVRTS